MTKTHRTSAQHCILTGIILSISPLISAQDADDFPVTDLDPYTVEARDDWMAPDRAELAGAGRLLAGVEGASRSVSWLTESLLTDTGVARLEDIFWQIPGAATQARFGVITVPTIRGDAAESLLNGQRRGDNLFGLPPTLTAVESVEIVAGAPLLRVGLGKRTGGLVNMTTKRPVLDRQFGSVEVRFGSWVPKGDSFTTLEGTLDLNLPVADGQALRLAVGLRDDETYYHRNGGRDDFQDIYAAWRIEGENGRTLDILGYYHTAERPQSLGVNRPWQGLIDHGLYVTGEVDSLVGQSEPPGFLDPGIADPGLLVSGPSDVVKLPDDRVLLSLGDTGKGEAYLGQAIYRQPLNPDLSFQQSVLIERVFREKANQFFFAEDVEQLTVDSLSRLLGESVNPLGPLSWETGAHFRLEKRENLTNYWNEFAYAFDILEGRRFSTPESFPGFIAPGAVSGSGDRSWYVPSSFFSTPESTDSRLRQAGLYGEISQEINQVWTIGMTLRADWLDVEASEPGDLAIPDPLSDSDTVSLLSGSISVRREYDHGQVYFTAGLYRGVAGNTVGDGINLHDTGKLNRDDFLNRSRLLEVGGQHTLSEQIHLTWAVFDQDRERQEFFGSNDISAQGAELAVDWRPRRETRVFLNGQYLDAHYENAAPAEFGGGSLWNVYAPGAGPTGEGNGLGYIGGFFLNSVAPGDHAIPGLSEWQFNAGLEQSISESWSLWVWGGWASEQQGNLASEYVIPSQMEWNASLSYDTGKWEVQLIARNLFNADNWIHNGDTFFDQMLISRNLPLRLEGRIRMRF